MVQMVILHIGKIKKSLFNGIAVSVKQNVRAQQELGENIALLNLLNVGVEGVCHCFFYKKGLQIEELPEPFNAPDLVVFHEIYYPSFLRLCRQAKKAAIPYVIVPHGCLTWVAQKKKWWKKLPANLLLFNSFIRGADAIQFLSLQELKNSRGTVRGFVGSNGMRLPDEKKEAFHSHCVKLVFIGRPEVKIKGLDLLIRAVRENGELLKSRNACVELYGPDHAGRHKEVRGLMEKWGVETLIKLRQAVAGEEKKKILLDADIFIQTSRSEGMPMGILEAMSYGVPCLVTRGTRLGEIVEEYDAGWVAETNAASIGAALRKALQERELWPVKSRNARRLVEENYQWHKVASETLEEYKKLLR